MLHYRRAVDGWSVTTDDFQILRLGDGPAQQPAKVRTSAQSAERNRRRRENHEIFREADWAEERRRCGWSEDRVAFHLERRAARQARDRARQDELQATHVAAGKVAHAARIEARRAERAAAEAEDRAVRRLPPDKVRRDSPGATVGHRRMKVDVLGLGRRRVDLGFEIPKGADVVRVTYLKPGWRGAKVEARLGMTVPPVEPKHDEAAVRLRLHAFARELPVSATPLQAALAARAAGIACVGIDFGSANPHCDDRGTTTRPVRIARFDWHRMRAAQASLSHKDECRRHGGSKPDQGKAKPHEAKVASEGETVAARTKGVSRSKRATRQLAEIRAVLARAANRSKTRACQDARAAMRDGPLLVATDPRRMTKPLLAKGGPAARRAKAGGAASAVVVAEPVTAASAVAALLPADATVPGGSPARRPFRMTLAMERALRRNLHATRFSYRLDRVGAIALALGTVHCTPGHEGTSSGCPACDRVAHKPLSRRVHECPCGLVMPRDQASAIMTLGRALLSFRDGPDPGGLHAARIEAEREARERRESRAKAMAAGAERARERRAAAKAASQQAGTEPPHPGRGAPGPLAKDKRKRVRNQGRNVRREG